MCYLALGRALRARRPVCLLVPIPCLLGKYQAGQVDSEPACRGGGRSSRPWESSGWWRRWGARSSLGAHYSESKRGQKSNLYARGGMKSIEMIRKVMRRSSLSFTGNFLWAFELCCTYRLCPGAWQADGGGNLSGQPEQGGLPLWSDADQVPVRSRFQSSYGWGVTCESSG